MIHADYDAQGRYGRSTRGSWRPGVREAGAMLAEFFVLAVEAKLKEMCQRLLKPVQKKAFGRVVDLACAVRIVTRLRWGQLTELFMALGAFQ
jgi:hypothetical protein